MLGVKRSPSLSIGTAKGADVEVLGLEVQPSW